MNYRGGMWEGGGGQDGVEGGEWDNCNSIINKYIKRKETHPPKKEKKKKIIEKENLFKQVFNAHKKSLFWGKNARKDINKAEE